MNTFQLQSVFFTCTSQVNLHLLHLNKLLKDTEMFWQCCTKQFMSDICFQVPVKFLTMQAPLLLFHSPKFIWNTVCFWALLPKRMHPTCCTQTCHKQKHQQRLQWRSQGKNKNPKMFLSACPLNKLNKNNPGFLFTEQQPRFDLWFPTLVIP